MKHKFITPLLTAACLVCLLCSTTQAQRERYNLQTYREQAPKRDASDWMLNIGAGYGTYYGDLSTYNIRRFEDIGLLRNFVSYNKNYITEPSLHLSVAKRLGSSSSGIGFNLNRTLIQGSDRYVKNNGTIQSSNPMFGRSLNFKTDILDAGLSFNFNGFTTGFFAPYLSIGAGFSFFDVKGDVFTGANQNVVYDYNNLRNVNDGVFETNLRDAQTETDAKYSNKVFYAQAVLGFNFQLSKTFSLAVESDVKYSGSDYLDDVSGTYKTSYPNLRSAYIAKPGYNVPNTNGDRGRNDGVNDFYIMNRIVFRFHLPKYVKRSQLRKIETKFNAPVLYPSNYETTPLDSAAYLKAKDKMKMGDTMLQRKMKDSVMMVRKDSLQADSLTKARTYNVKMDTAYTNELKALRLELANLRQTIGGTGMVVKGKDSIAVKRASLKDSLNNSIQKLQQKKKKTATDSLQLQINRLRVDSINIADRVAMQQDSMMAATNASTAVRTSNNAIVPVATSTNLNANYKSQDDSLRRMIDSLKNLNSRTVTTTQPRAATQVDLPNKNIRSIKDTISAQNAQQYQQQIAGLNYRSQQVGLTNAQRKSRLDSINQLSTSLRASDSVRVAYYQSQLAKSQQQEENLASTEKRGLLVKKTDATKKAEQDRANAEAALIAAQNTQRTNLQNASVAGGDTNYVSNLRRQYNARQVEIDSLKNNKKALDIFSSKNRRIKELEDQQKAQQQQIDDANKQLQYYRNTGPTSYAQPQYYPQQQIVQQPNYSNQFDDYNKRITDIEKQRLALQSLSLAQQTLQPPVSSASPVVVSTTNTDTSNAARLRLQRQIDSLRNEVAQLRRPDTSSRRPIVDSSLQKSLTTANTTSNDMAAIQRQLTELNNRLNNRTAVAAPVVPTPPATTASATAYFTKGSAVLSTLQKAKLAAFVKKHKKTDTYTLNAGSDNTTGNTAANKVLARKRATAVTTYLKAQRIPAANITSNVDANNGEPGGDPNPLAKRVIVSVR